MSLAAVRKAEILAPGLPWNTFRPDDLGPAIMQHCRDYEPYFRRWAEVWFQNFQFIYGNHNIKWSRRYGFAVDHDFFSTQTPNSWTFNVYTNLVRVVAEALASLVYSNLPAWETQAMDESKLKNKRFEKITQKFLDCYMQRLLMDKEFTAAAQIFTTFGQVASYVGWKNHLGRILEIPRMRLVKRPAFSSYMAPNQATGGLLEVPTPIVDQAHQPLMEQTWEEVLDTAGRQVIDKIFAGDGGVDMLTPFEYRRETGSYGFHKTSFTQRFRLLDYDKYLEEYSDIPGKTDLFDKIRPVSHDETLWAFAVRHFMRMQFTTSPTLSDDASERAVFKNNLMKYKVFVVEHHDRPHKDKWPKGRRTIVANGFATHITTPDFQTGKLDGWHPYTEAQWMAIPPSSISTGPLNDTTRKNREVNLKDSLIATAVRRNMGSKLLLKTGMGLDPQEMSGDPGTVHQVNDPYGARWLHDEMPIPPVISRLREMDKEDIYESSGAIEALRGMPSTGASSGYQEKQREEREEKRLAPARKTFEFFASGTGEKLFQCVKQNAKGHLDPEVMGYMRRAAAGEFSPQDVVALLTTPVDYGVEIKVVKSSMALKSKATQQATMQELAGGPLKTRLEQDARVLDKYLKYFDAETLRDSSAPHRDRASRENEAWLDMLRLGPQAEGSKVPLVLFEDDDDVHQGEHDEFLVTNFDELRNHPWLLTMIYEHKERHRLQKMEKTGQLMPGTSLQTGTMMEAAQATTPPTVMTIMQDAQRRAIMAQMQQTQAPGGQPPEPQPTGGPPTGRGAGTAGAPQAPTQPAAAGAPQARRIDTNAPSQNTPAGARQSVAMRRQGP